MNTQGSTRRDFLKTSGGALAGAALTSAIASKAYAATEETIKVALVGCGGRGTGAAAQALSTAGPTKLVAMADVFKDRMDASYRSLAKPFEKKVDCPPERQFIGFDAFKRAVEAVGPGGVVLLATPPTFRPLHVEYAVEKGCHIFMEKSFGVDAPGVRRIMRAGEEAKKKNLKIAGGLMSRHSRPLEGAVKAIHEGIIGDVITAWAYREHGPVGFGPKRAGESEVAHQIRNYSNFTWVNGSFLLDWLIHNIDVCCWVKDAWPVSCQGQGGRQVRTEPDQLFDHYSAEYTFPDGTRMLAQGRHLNNCWNFFGDVIQGTKGCAVLGEGIDQPRIYKGYRPVKGNLVWEFKGEPGNSYQIEHDLLFDAIRNDKPYNEANRCAKAAMTAILGRMAVECGQMVTWEQAFNSELELAPELEKLDMNSTPPVAPDARGQYPIAMPGKTKSF